MNNTKKAKPKNARCEIRINADTKRRAVAAAARGGVSLSEYINVLVEKEIKQPAAG